MIKGDTYCTMWTDYIGGPFTYDGLSNINDDNVIIGHTDSLKLVMQGFIYMHNMYINGEFDYVKRVQEFVSQEVIDNHINICDNSELINQLYELKRYGPKIIKIISGCK